MSEHEGLIGRLREAADAYPYISQPLREAADALEAAEKRQVFCGQHTSATDPHLPSDVSACWGCYADALEALKRPSLNRLYTYPHMCRDGHPQIGHREDGEMCPLCEALARVPSPECVEAVRKVARWATIFEDPNTFTTAYARDRARDALIALRAHWPSGWGEWPGSGA